METATSSAPAEPSSEDLFAFFDDVRAAERLIARAVRRAGQLAGSGVCERVEGGSLDWALGMVCRMVGSDTRVLVGAGEMLRHLPTVDRLFAEGALSWGQVRRIVAAARRLRADQRAELDARVAAAMEVYDGIDAFDPDHLVDAVDAAADELKRPRAQECREERAEQANTLQVQPGFDGGVFGWFRFDAVTGAMVINGLDAAADRPMADDADGAGGGRSTAAEEGLAEGTTRRGRQYADALVRLARNYLGGPNPHQARPLLVAHFQTGKDADGSGYIELNLRGKIHRVSGKVLELLAADANFQAVLFDGAMPLAVSRKLYADSLPDDVRFAVRARDLGCRFPGSRDPIGHTDIHHLKHRADGGSNAVGNLAALSRRRHTQVHRHDWRIEVDGHTGALTARRRHRVWRSLPRGTGLPPPRPGPASVGPDADSHAGPSSDPSTGEAALPF